MSAFKKNNFILLWILFFQAFPQYAFSQQSDINKINDLIANAQYKGADERLVVKVNYNSKKSSGSFIKVGPNEWLEINDEGTFHLYEAGRRTRGEIKLEDSSRNRRYYIELNDRVINKSKIGKFVSVTQEFYISDFENGDWKTMQASLAANDQNTNQSNQAQAPGENKKDENDFEIPELNTAPVYHAILIAENHYTDKNFNSLPGTVRDIRKLYDLLTTKYTFDPANTDTLIDASRETILSRLNAKAKTMTENDNLFIFYAGHGWVKPFNDGSGKEEGFLIPSDAVKDDEITFINSDDITRIINRGSRAKHILFTADACFAGSLFRDIAADAPLTVKDAYKEKSRKLLSSGNRQTVSDESDFVEFLRLALQENHEKYITAEQLLDHFKNTYREKTNMQLQYYPIQGVGDMGGQFVFIHR